MHICTTEKAIFLYILGVTVVPRVCVMNLIFCVLCHCYESISCNKNSSLSIVLKVRVASIKSLGNEIRPFKWKMRAWKEVWM